LRPLSRAAALAALLAAACGAGPGSRPPTPVPTPTGPHVVLPSGAIYEVELALTPDEQARGLMFRESLRDRAGMLFVFAQNPPIPHHFWMKNTMIPLDMVWLDSDGNVLFVNPHTPPCKADPCPMYGPDIPAPLVLEIAGGLAEKEGVKVGSRIAIRVAQAAAPPASR
jgi:uncharacterized membrane protein (UPF0127 family)